MPVSDNISRMGNMTPSRARISAIGSDLDVDAIPDSLDPELAGRLLLFGHRDVDLPARLERYVRGPAGWCPRG